jgi:hypothetical protein
MTLRFGGYMNVECHGASQEATHIEASILIFPFVGDNAYVSDADSLYDIAFPHESRRPFLGLRFVNRHAFRKNDPWLCTTRPVMRRGLEPRCVIQCSASHDSLFGSHYVQL